jgi:light-regulated signal transduction histidine kinase (bacteriophytochrome)
VRFEDIIHEVPGHGRGRLEESNQAQVSVQHNLPIVYGDKIRLVEVDQNLLDHAAKFPTRTL